MAKSRASWQEPPGEPHPQQPGTSPPAPLSASPGQAPLRSLFRFHSGFAGWENGSGADTTEPCGAIVSTDGDRITLQTSGPAPPGCVLEATLGDSPGIYRVKVRDCRRTGEEPPSYRIEGRLVNLSREQRQRLLNGQ